MHLYCLQAVHETDKGIIHNSTKTIEHYNWGLQACLIGYKTEPWQYINSMDNVTTFKAGVTKYPNYKGTI